MHIETWDRTSLQEQEDIFGRDKGEGAPVGKAQGAGQAVPEGDAARRARTARAPGHQRRGDASCAAATPSPTARTASAGWTRACSSSPTSGTSARASSRCSGAWRRDALNEYIQHVGSAVFAVPPGVRDEDDWWGRALFSKDSKSAASSIGGKAVFAQLPDRPARGPGSQPRRLHPHRLSGQDRTGGTPCSRSGSASRRGGARARLRLRARVRLPGADVRGAGGARRLAVDHRGRPGDVDGLLDAAYRAASEGRAARQAGRGAADGHRARWSPPRSWRWAARAWRRPCSSGPSVHASSDGERPLIGVLLGIATAVVARLAVLPRRPADQPRQVLHLDRRHAGRRGRGRARVRLPRPPGGRLPAGPDEQGLRHQRQIPPDSWYGTLLKGVFNFQPDPTVLQVVVWAAVPAPDARLLPGSFTVRRGEVDHTRPGARRGLKPASPNRPGRPGPQCGSGIRSGRPRASRPR